MAPKSAFHATHLVITKYINIKDTFGKATKCRKKNTKAEMKQMLKSNHN